MTWDVRGVAVSDLGRIHDQLLAWQGPQAYGGGMQAGDFGWKFRFGRQTVADSLTEFVDDDGAVGAIMLNDTPATWWFAIDPGLLLDEGLAEAIGDYADSLPRNLDISVDGPHAQAAWRRAVARRGFDTSLNDLYVHFWQPLSEADIVDVPGVAPTRTDEDIADRVFVQRNSFERSTFTVERWHAMAEGPGFRPELDLVARTDRGEPAAALPAWFAGEGRCGMIEPLGTHPDFRRQGHGTRVLRAACSALAAMGANGVTVLTYHSSPAAVGVYRAAGFRCMDIISAMERPGTDRS
jgi:ribosomal protein S18 acetylase RimI-like enzyme